LRPTNPATDLDTLAAVSYCGGKGHVALHSRVGGADAVEEAIAADEDIAQGGRNGG
jgi:hypothetical protein